MTSQAEEEMQAMMARMREMEQKMLRKQAEEKSGMEGAELESKFESKFGEEQEGDGAVAVSSSEQQQQQQRPPVMFFARPPAPYERSRTAPYLHQSTRLLRRVPDERRAA